MSSSVLSAASLEAFPIALQYQAPPSTKLQRNFVAQQYCGNCCDNKLKFHSQQQARVRAVTRWLVLSLLLLTGGRPQQKYFRDVPRFIQVRIYYMPGMLKNWCTEPVKLVKVSTCADDLAAVTLTQDQTQGENWLTKNENKQRF